MAKRENRKEKGTLITMSSSEELVLRELNETKAHPRFMQNYFHFLTVAKTLPSQDNYVELVQSLELAEQIYRRIRVDEIQHSRNNLVRWAVDWLKRDYKPVFDYINRDRGK